MDARERLLRTGLSHEFVDMVLDQHAHELAEAIRQAPFTPTGDEAYDDGNEAGRDFAADSIDPEAP